MLPSLSALLLVSTASAAVFSNRQIVPESTVCEGIEKSISGGVYYPVLPLNANFTNDTEHYMTSSSQTPTCVVEVANPEDVSIVMKAVGLTRTPFAVKSGGHASNPGFSSTPGVFISLVRLKEVTLSSDKSTVEVGFGNVWTDVYTALQGTGVNVVGGRVEGPGVGGFTLGGGYSWLTNQYGLTCDTVQAFNLVLPNGTVTQVTSASPDLFFALKGGLNRFGIVTSAVFKTKPQTDVWGGIKFYGSDAVPALINATEAFQSEQRDPKAQAILTLNSGSLPGAILLLFYDGPDEPPSFAPYDEVDSAFPPLINAAKSQTYESFSQGSPSQVEAGYRGAFATMMTTTLTTSFLTAVANESTFYGSLALLHSGNLVSYDTEPFGNYGAFATDSAFPHANSPLPLNLYFSWSLEADDAYWRGVMQQSIDHLTEVAKAEGIFPEDTPVYPNYALDTYSGAQLYGAANTARLREIQAKYDPLGVMQLTGGFTF